MVADLWCEDGVACRTEIPEQMPRVIDAPVLTDRVPGQTMYLARFYPVCVYRAPDGRQVAVYATRRYATP